MSLKLSGWRGALVTLVFAWGCAPSVTEAPAPGEVQPDARRSQSLEFDRRDMDFVLAQIRIAEAHANGSALPDLVADPLLPWGLRTVDGTWNNLVAGQDAFGSSRRAFINLLPAWLRTAEGAAFDPDGPGPLTVGSPSSYAQFNGLVFDSHPRVVSNLIVDQSADNPAATAAASRVDGALPNVDGAGTWFIPNVTPDVGLSAPYNAWFILFGQFFDHGLDLVEKGGSGTVFIPLNEDDPLYVPGAQTNFMVLTRATNQPGGDGVLGTHDDVREYLNRTTPYVDQNQTYTSHPSHQVFLRHYVLNASGRPVSTGKLLDGARHGLANWAEVKAQAATLLGILLTDEDVTRVPLLATDPYGRFLPGPSGFPQLVTASGLLEGNPSSPVPAASALEAGHAFLDDIAHHAVPTGLAPDADSLVGGPPPVTGTYDDELLAVHYITGDGRGNENIGLTAVHTVFHAEHNRMVEAMKAQIAASPDSSFISEWLLPGATAADGIDPSEWNGERLFGAARLGTEMQYQHLVFEEFARKVQPLVNIFSGYDTTIDAAIMGEFAHVVYRFGHSMLTETLARTDENGVKHDLPLLDAFLNPPAFAQLGANDLEAAGAIVRGMTRQVGNETDEFVTGALRNNLLGLPLDLATINLARGRDVGVPPLNTARRMFFADTGHGALRPYSSWVDFGHGMRNPESLVNFVAAYGTHPTVQSATTVADKRAAAALLVHGGAGAPADAPDFMNSTGAWSTHDSGLEGVDFWMGGLAEKQMVFGGLLGSTFNFVFEKQMELLQDGDRFYYLHRNVGLNLFTQLEEASFAEMVMRNTGVRVLPADVFSRPAFTFDFANLGASGPVLDDPTTDEDESTELWRMPDGTLRYTGVEHVVMTGTAGNDRMWASEGDDSLWGGPGDDWMEGGDGADSLLGGDGDDIITDLNGDDMIKGGAGNDVINCGAGLDLVLAGTGNDFVVAPDDENEVFAGDGMDFVLGGTGMDTIFGGEGDDWIEGAGGADLLQGDNGERFQNSTIPGNDVIIGGGGNDDYDAESGDDIMVSGEGTERHEGMLGFDWVTYKGVVGPVDADLERSVLLPPDQDDVRDRFDEVEGLSGWDGDDILRGDERDPEEFDDVEDVSGFNNALSTPAQVALIDGLEALLGATSFTGGNILLGGKGNDIFEGRAGNDLIDGDAWLNVRIAILDGAGAQIGTADGMSKPITGKSGVLAGTPAALTLVDAMFSRLLNPGQLRIVREILTPPGGTDVDIALYSDSVNSYDLTRNADGSINVAHARGLQTDGTDRLRNVERLQFTDALVDTATITVPAAAPPPVTGLHLTAGDALLTLTWGNPTEATGVRILRSTSNFATSPTLAAGQTVVSDALATSFADTDVFNGVTYFYTLFVRDLAGNYSVRSTVSGAPVAPIPGGTDAGTGTPGGTDAGTGGTDPGPGGTDAGTGGTGGGNGGGCSAGGGLAPLLGFLALAGLSRRRRR